MKSLPDLSDYPLVTVIQYLGNTPDLFLPLLEVCKAWYQRFDTKDESFWKVIAITFRVHLPVSAMPTFTLRSRSHFKQLFLKSYRKKRKDLQEKHDLLIINARNILMRPIDSPKQLQKLIAMYFPDALDFDVNWRCATLENNSLLTLSARCCHLKCMKLLVDHYGANVNNCDVGGFNALILCSYHGFFEGVRFCIKKGANYRLTGRLRSGACLTAEHWAAVRGQKAIFNFLRAVRMRDDGKHQQQQALCCAGDHHHHQDGQSSLPIMPPPPPLPDIVEDRTIFTNLPTLPYDEFGQQLLQITLDSQPSTQPFYYRQVYPADQPTGHGQSTDGGDSFCICGRGFDSFMIACDSMGCSIEWFHFDCVGIDAAPDGPWFCPDCCGESFLEPIKIRKRLCAGRGHGRRKKFKENPPHYNNETGSGNSSNSNTGSSSSSSGQNVDNEEGMIVEVTAVEESKEEADPLHASQSPYQLP